MFYPFSELFSRCGAWLTQRSGRFNPGKGSDVSIVREAINRSTGGIFYLVLDPDSLIEYEFSEFKFSATLLFNNSRALRCVSSLAYV